jgi:hypothetical protein
MHGPRTNFLSIDWTFSWATSSSGLGERNFSGFVSSPVGAIAALFGARGNSWITKLASAGDDIVGNTVLKYWADSFTCPSRKSHVSKSLTMSHEEEPSERFRVLFPKSEPIRQTPIRGQGEYAENARISVGFHLAGC